jgi:hypothetical protein
MSMSFPECPRNSRTIVVLDWVPKNHLLVCFQQWQKRPPRIVTSLEHQVGILERVLWCTKLCALFAFPILFILSLVHPSINTVTPQNFRITLCDSSVINLVVHRRSFDKLLMLCELLLTAFFSRPISKCGEVFYIKIYWTYSQISHTDSNSLFICTVCVCVLSDF